ncbi:MAG: hypothetical protein J5886_02680 [Bacteroidales bacterium]|nr:hypothetical protein [Bacteroidales bacterium]
METAVSRGFVTMATGKELYYILARNLLISYHLHNSNPKPFAIICDRRNEITEEFDDVVIMDSPLFSFNDKLRLADLTPYDETIFIDADCLVVHNLDGMWDIVKNSPDFGIYGAVYDPDSEMGKAELERSGQLRDRMHAPCSCQGGMRFVRKSPSLKGFTELSLFIYDNYAEFQMPDHPKPSDDMIFPLACSIYGFLPSEDWWKIFCWYPEARFRRLDVVTGEVSYLWTVMNIELGPECYFIHFGTMSTKEWLYCRESYRMLCHINGKRPSRMRLALIWIRCFFVKLKRIIVYAAKRFVYKMVSRK